MKKIYLLLVTLALAGSIGSADAQVIKLSGSMASQKRDVGHFTSFSVGSGIDVVVTPSSAFSVEVRADKNVVPYVTTDIVRGSLRIGYTDRIKGKNIRATVHIKCPTLENINVSSGSDVKIKGVMEGRKLNITASSASDLEGAVRYESINVTCSSGADVELTGRADLLKITSASGADVKASGLVAENVTVTVASGADVSVHATHKINARAASGGSVTYYGDPQIRDVKNSSGGSVRAR